MVIEDLIIMGRACPEPLRDGRVTVCLAGWSERYGFIRLYPARPDMPRRQWDIVRVSVERNPRDGRQESWKIAGARSEWNDLDKRVEIVGRFDNKEYRHSLVASLVDEGLHVIKEQGRSLGIIRPQIIRAYFRENPRYIETWQMGLPDLSDVSHYQVKRNFPYEPRIKYTYPGCRNKTGYHDHQVLEWGFYEWFRKNPGLSVLRFKAGPTTLPLLPYRKLPDG